MSANWAEKTRVGHFVAKPDASSPLICILTIRMEAAGCRPPLERVESVFSSDEACDIFPDQLRYPDRRLWLRWRLGATQGRQALYYPTLPASLQGGHFPSTPNCTRAKFAWKHPNEGISLMMAHIWLKRFISSLKVHTCN